MKHYNYSMGLTFVRMNIKNPARPRKTFAEKFLVDSGALYSVVSEKNLLELGIKPQRIQEFTMADGTHVSRKIGDAIFELDGVQAPAPVIFGKKGDATLLGVVTLEALGLMLDPLQRKLRPMKLRL